MNGRIVKLVISKWFGFIKSGQYEYFFHKDDSTIPWEDLHIGKDVSFEEFTTPKGLRAKNVRETYE